MLYLSLRQARPQPQRPRGLILWDEVGDKGKTSWARSLGRHTYWQGRPSPKTLWDPHASFLVMDDFTTKPDIGLWKGVMGGQARLNLRDLHFNKEVDWGRPAIYLCNELPALTEWDVANICVVYVSRKLY